MMKMKRQTLHILIAAALGCMHGASFANTAYPTKPIRLVIPYAAGGGTDLLGRILAKQLGESLGQSIVIDNRPGGATLPATEVVASAAPDGYTLLLTNIALAANQSLMRKVPYDAAKDFTPVSLVATVPTVLVVHPSVPARSVKELIDYAKKNPGRLTYASAGNGSSNQLTAEVFKNAAGVDIVHVPYKGGAPAVQDTVAGHVSMMFATTSVSMQHARANKLLVLGISTAKRNPLNPEIPTISESGLPGFDVVEWQMLLAPAGTPPAIVERLNKDLLKAMASAEVRDGIAKLGSSPVGNSPQEAKEYLHAELARWSKLIRDAGIKPVD